MGFLFWKIGGFTMGFLDWLYLAWLIVQVIGSFCLVVGSVAFLVWLWRNPPRGGA